jgi:site-specific recombinase XerD
MQDIKEQVYGIERQLNTAKKNLHRHKGVSKRNQRLILDFVRFGEAKGLSAHRLMTYIKYMRSFAKIVKVDFDKATRDDMEKAFAYLNRKGYSDWTLQTHKDVTKAYWRWLYKLGKRDALPPCVNWIEGQKFPTKLTSEDLLTEEDIQNIIVSSSAFVRTPFSTPHFRYTVLFHKS